MCIACGVRANASSAIGHAIDSRAPPCWRFAAVTLGSLDEASSAVVFDLLLDPVGKEGITLVMATHDRGLARRCSRLVEMHDGRVHGPESR